MKFGNYFQVLSILSCFRGILQFIKLTIFADKEKHWQDCKCFPNIIARWEWISLMIPKSEFVPSIIGVPLFSDIIHPSPDLLWLPLPSDVINSSSLFWINNTNDLIPTSWHEYINFYFQLRRDLICWVKVLWVNLITEDINILGWVLNTLLSIYWDRVSWNCRYWFHWINIYFDCVVLMNISSWKG